MSEKIYIIGGSIHGEKRFRTTTGWTESSNAAKRYTESAALELVEQIKESGFKQVETIIAR
jgi:hypothetical protein